MLSTIVSRCQKISFMPLGDAEMFRLLKEKGTEGEAAEKVVSHGQGSIKRALFLLESDFLSKRAEVTQHLSRLSKGHFEAAFDIAKLIYDDPGRAALFEFLQTWYRDILFIKEGLSASLICNPDLLEEMSLMAGSETMEGVLKKIKKLQWFNNNPATTVNIEMGLQSLFIQGI